MSRLNPVKGPTDMSQPAKKSATPVTDHLRATRNFNPAWDELAEMDPAWLEKFLDMGTTPIAAGVLDPLTYEFIAIAVDASCTHLYAPGVRRHIRKALALGATPQEILAVLQSVAVLGIHSCALGAPILAEEVARAATEKASSARSMNPQPPTGER
jgi:alkylhydroperoxidase/carboxymuconolactone decarboxylase family protein YurZ